MVPKFGEVAERLLEQRAEDRDWSSSWKRTNRYALPKLTRAFGQTPLTQITRVAIERYKRQRRKEVSGPSVNRELALLSGLLQVAVEEGLLPSNPVRGVRRYRENENAWRYLSPEQAETLIECCSARLRPVVMCAIFTGMRAGEIRALTWERVDLGRSLIWIPDSKSGEPREVPLHPVLRKELARLRRHRSSGHVFVKEDGTPYRDWRTAWAKATERAGLEGLRFHDLRHTFGTWQTSLGTHPFVLQDLMGHKTSVMTRRYSHATTPAKRAAVGSLPSVGDPDRMEGSDPPTRDQRPADPGES